MWWHTTFLEHIVHNSVNPKKGPMYSKFLVYVALDTYVLYILYIYAFFFRYMSYNYIQYAPPCPSRFFQVFFCALWSSSFSRAASHSASFWVNPLLDKSSWERGFPKATKDGEGQHSSVEGCGKISIFQLADFKATSSWVLQSLPGAFILEDRC